MASFDRNYIKSTRPLIYTEDYYEDILKHINCKFRKALRDHQRELSRVELELSRRFIVTGEKEALQEKRRLLLLQKAEFLKYHQVAVYDLTETKDHRLERRDTVTSFKQTADKIRQRFSAECRRFGNGLPIYTRRSDIVDTVRRHQVSVIIGETGSGKSTQIVQYLYEEGFADAGMIACTQPRKVAAANLASHVAQEMDSFVGQLVGQKVGGYTKRGIRTKILYTTEYCMLRECLEDRNLSAYSCIMIDEAHERTIYTDLLLGILRRCLDTRPDLRIIVTSATIDPEVFVRYFRECQVLHVSGKLFPVEVVWKQPEDGVDSFDKYEEQAVKKAVQVHRSEPQGDLLVFVTSPLETEMCSQKFERLMRSKAENNYVTMQLHGQLEREEQQKVFDPVPDGMRKIIFATNCAETSVTIPRIKYVIDTGLAKEMKYDPVRKMKTLMVTMVSQASARQRMGRAGRLGPGKCYRLYTEDDYQKMNVDYIPEMLRVQIGQVLLKLMEFDIDPMDFDYIESPSAVSLEEAYTSLKDIGAVEDRKLTDLGEWIAKLPFDPKYGAFIYEAYESLLCLEAIVMTAATESGFSLYDKERRYKPFCHDGGDQLTVLKVFREWHQLPNEDRAPWCSSNSINDRLLKHIEGTTRETLQTLKEKMDIFVKFDFQIKPETAEKMLVGFLLKTLSKNLCYIFGKGKNTYYNLSQNQVVQLHPSSVVLSLKSPPDWIVFNVIQQSSARFVMDVTPVPESELLKAVENGWLKLEIEEAKKKCTVTPFHKHMGAQMFREFVGPNCDNVKDIEAKLTTKFPDNIITVKIREDTGRVTVLSNVSEESKLSQVFLEMFSPPITKYKLEDSEEYLGSRQPIGAGVRAVVGAGGSVKTILMPEETRVVRVHCDEDMRHKWSEEGIAGKFSEYGKIIHCKKLYNEKDQPTVWGQITYQKPEDAMQAVKETRKVQSTSLTAHPHGALPIPTNVRLKVMIQCCRRPSKGYGCIEFKHRSAYRRALRHRQIKVAGSLAQIQESHKPGKWVRISKFGPHVSEHVLRDAVVDALLLRSKDIKRVVVARELVNLDKKIYRNFRRRLLDKIKQHVNPNDFELEMQEPQSDQDTNIVGYCVFNKYEEGIAACRDINNEFIFDGEAVLLTQGLQWSKVIHESVYNVYCEVIKRLINFFMLEGLQLSLSKKSGRVTMNLFSEDTGSACVKFFMARYAILKVLSRNDNLYSEMFLVPEVRQQLQTIMDKTGAVIVLDERKYHISVHGSVRKKKMAFDEIEKYGKEFYAKLSQNYKVKVCDEIMTELKAKYKNGLFGLKDEAGLTSVEYDNKTNRLRFAGPREAISEAKKTLRDIGNTLMKDGILNVRNICRACLYLSDPLDMYRIECCGHALCEECIEEVMKTTIERSYFPIECGFGDCPAVFVWRDFANLYREGHLTLASLVSSSVKDFVFEHRNEFRYCPTPDCPIVYKVTQEGRPFLCSECDVVTCTRCHGPHYYGHKCCIVKSRRRKGEKSRFPMNKKTKQIQENKQQRAFEKDDVRQSSPRIASRSVKKKHRPRGEKGKHRELRMLLDETQVLAEEEEEENYLDWPASHSENMY